jgi:hypothetical protein
MGDNTEMGTLAVTEELHAKQQEAAARKPSARPGRRRRTRLRMRRAKPGNQRLKGSTARSSPPPSRSAIGGRACRRKAPSARAPAREARPPRRRRNRTGSTPPAGLLPGVGSSTPRGRGPPPLAPLTWDYLRLMSTPVGSPHQRSPTAGSTAYRSRGCMSGPDAQSFLQRGRPVLAHRVCATIWPKSAAGRSGHSPSDRSVANDPLRKPRLHRTAEINEPQRDAGAVLIRWSARCNWLGSPHA